MAAGRERGKAFKEKITHILAFVKWDAIHNAKGEVFVYGPNRRKPSKPQEGLVLQSIPAMLASLRCLGARLTR